MLSLTNCLPCSLVPDALQIIAAVLVVNFALLLHVRFEPYDRAELNNLETGALVAVLVTQVRTCPGFL